MLFDVYKYFLGISTFVYMLYLHGHRGSEELSRGGSRDYCWMS